MPPGRARGEGREAITAARPAPSHGANRTSSASVRQRQPPPALRNSSTGDSAIEKPHASSWRPTRGGTDGMTMLRPTTTELAQNVSASSSVSHSGSGTRASTTLRP